MSHQSTEPTVTETLNAAIVEAVHQHDSAYLTALAAALTAVTASAAVERLSRESK